MRSFEKDGKLVITSYLGAERSKSGKREERKRELPTIPSDPSEWIAWSQDHDEIAEEKGWDARLGANGIREMIQRGVKLLHQAEMNKRMADALGKPAEAGSKAPAAAKDAEGIEEI